jgi:hypothetical protein
MINIAGLSRQLEIVGERVSWCRESDADRLWVQTSSSVRVVSIRDRVIQPFCRMWANYFFG